MGVLGNNPQLGGQQVISQQRLNEILTADVDQGPKPPMPSMPMPQMPQQTNINIDLMRISVQMPNDGSGNMDEQSRQILQNYIQMNQQMPMMPNMMYPQPMQNQNMQGLPA